VDLGGGPVGLDVPLLPMTGRDGLWLDRCPWWTHVQPSSAAFVDAGGADLMGVAVAIGETDGLKAVTLSPRATGLAGTAVALAVGRALWRQRVAAGCDPAPVVTSASRPAGRLAPRLVAVPHEVAFVSVPTSRRSLVWEVLNVVRVADWLASLRPGAASWLPDLAGEPV
jgi:hypothetical protein